MQQPLIIVENISKSYGKVTALNDVSFSVGHAELFGLIGPDGAGKTTLLRILATLLLPGSGKAIVAGLDTVKDYKALRRILGYMPGRFSLYTDLSVEENLRFFAGIFKTTPEKNYDLVKDIYSQIEPFKNRKAGKLSGGMKQKLALSCALIHKPEVLILDEPTTGVDAVSRREFWDMLFNLKKAGITIIVSTPYMDEATRCDRVALIQKSNIMAIDTPANIVQSFAHPLRAIRSADMYKLLTDLRNLPETRSVFPFGQFVHFTSKNKILNEEPIIEFLHEKGHTDVEIIQTEPTIEDCFMDLMVNNAESTAK